VHVSLTLSPSRSALPRVVSVIHGKGWEIAHLHAHGTSVCVLLEGSSLERAVEVLSRVVDVLEVRSGSVSHAGAGAGAPRSAVPRSASAVR
jgi:hypothetical protein